MSACTILQISDQLESNLRESHDQIFSESIAMQYAMYTTIFIATLGGAFFLWSTLTVEKDKKVSHITILRVQSELYFIGCGVSNT